MTTRKKKILDQISKAARIGSNLAGIVVHMKGKPSVIDGLAIVSRLVSSYNEVTRMDPIDNFKGWDRLNVEPLTSTFLSLSSVKGIQEEISSFGSNSKVLIVEIQGARVGWIQHDQWIQGPWHDNFLNEEGIQNLVAKMIWEEYGPNLLIDKKIGGIDITSDLLADSVSSGTAEELYGELSKFLKKGYSRAVLLYGEPGTGKTCIMRQVAIMAGGFAVRIKARKAENVTELGRALKMLHPNAVLIDDIDRAPEPEGLLESIENARAGCPLLIATANDIPKLDRALIRPGRFDIIREIDKLDDAVLERLLGKFPPNIREEARKMPIAYLDELRKIVEVVGPDKAISEIHSLKARFDAIREKSTNNESGGPVNLTKKNGASNKLQEAVGTY